MIVGATVLGSFLLVGAIIGAMIVNRDKPDPDVAAMQPADQTNGNAVDDEDDSPPDAMSEKKGDKNSSNTDPTDPLDNSDTDGTGQQQPPAIGDSPPPIDTMPPEIETKDDSVPPTTNKTDQENSTPGQPSFPENPLGDAPKIDDASPDVGETKKKAKGFDDLLNDRDLTGSAVVELPQLGKLETLLDDAGTSVMEMKDVASAQRDRDMVGLSKYFIAKPEPINVNIDRQMNMDFGAIKFENKPLLSMLRTLQTPIGIPFHVDTYSWQSRSTRFDINANIFIPEKVSLADALDAALAEHQLSHSYDAATNTISIRNLDAFTPEDQEFELPASIPADNRESLVKNIKTTIVPEYWNRPQDPGTIALNDNKINVTAYPVVHMRIGNLLEKLKAVEKQNENPDPASRDTLKTKLEKSQVLANPSNLDVTVDMPIPWFLTRLQEKSGAIVLVDWASVQAENWNPKTEIPGDLVEPNVQDVIGQLARSMNLTWRVVDEKTIELTTFNSAAQKTDLEVYDCKAILDKGIEVDELKDFVFFNLLGGQLRSTPFVWIFYQEDLQCFVVIAPQSLQRQISSVMVRLRQ